MFSSEQRGHLTAILFLLCLTEGKQEACHVLWPASNGHRRISYEVTVAVTVTVTVAVAVSMHTRATAGR